MAFKGAGLILREVIFLTWVSAPRFQGREDVDDL